MAIETFPSQEQWTKRAFLRAGALASLTYVMGCRVRQTTESGTNRKAQKTPNEINEIRKATFLKIKRYAEENYGDAIVEMHEGGPIVLLLYGEDHFEDRAAVKASIERVEQDCNLEALGFEGFVEHPNSEAHRHVNEYVAEVLSRGGGTLIDTDPAKEMSAARDPRSMEPYFYDTRFAVTLGLETKELAKATALAHMAYESILNLGNVAAEEDLHLAKEATGGTWIHEDFVTLINVERAMRSELGFTSYPQIDIAALKKNGYVLNRNNWEIIGRLRSEFDAWTSREMLGSRNSHAVQTMIKTMQKSGLTKGAMVFGKLHFRNNKSTEGPFDQYIVGPSIQDTIKQQYGEKVGYIRLDGAKLPHSKEETRELP